MQGKIILGFLYVNTDLKAQWTVFTQGKQACTQTGLLRCLNKVRGYKTELEGATSSQLLTKHRGKQTSSEHHCRWLQKRLLTGKVKEKLERTKTFHDGIQVWWGNYLLARQADFALRALPTCPPQRGHSHVQAHPMVMQTTTGAEELVQQVPRAIAQHAIYLIYNYG